MAYPAVSAPYGLKPINLIGGQVFAGATRKLPIQYGYATDIFYGDFVQLTRGFVERLSVSTAGGDTGLCGIFLGVSYTNPTTKQKQFAQYWPGGTAAGDAEAIICDDPDTVFKAVVCSSGTTVASGSNAMVGRNYQMINNSGNANTGDSKNALLYSATTDTGTFPIRVVGVVPDTAIVTSTTGTSSTTTVTTSALPIALPVGTDFGYIAANGQYVGSGSFVSVAAAAGATSVTINAAVYGGDISSSSTLVFTQYPEMQVKLNFGIHEYYTATAY
jgi:hypothetical protein